MKRRSILALILTLLLIASISIVGCGRQITPGDGVRGNNFSTGAENDTDGNTGGTAGGTTGENGAGGTSDGVGGNTQGNMFGGGNDNARGATDATKDRLEATADSIRYGSANFANDIRNAGYDATESTDNRSNYFTGNETDYMLGGDVVRLYEYNSAADLEGDINRIAPDGMTINGTNANYNSRPYYYRKGNTLIVYEGNEPAFINEFRNIYGDPLR